MFFDDYKVQRKKTQLRILPPVPDTGWLPPRSFPRLDDALCISIDTEAKEYDFSKGPGWSRGQSHTVGVSVCAYDGHRFDSWYFPFAHEVEPEYNLDKAHVLAWLKDTLSADTPKIGANLVYDIGNLSDVGITPGGKYYDCQFAEALLSEDGEVNLDYLGQKYLGEGKETSQLYLWLREAYGSAKYDQRENIYRASPRLVGPYAERDASHPLRVLMKQWPIMEEQNLLQAFDLECGLIPLMVQMRQQGVRVDIDATEQLYGEMTPIIDAERLKLKELCGVWANVNSPDDLKTIFDRLRIKYPRTVLGAPSFRKDWLKAQEHPAAKIITHIRELEKLQSTFLKGYILESHIRGKVHGQFHLLRSDADGTRSGRLSSSTPNLQNIPARGSLAKKIRALYLPDVGHYCWEKGDYSQIEYRFLAHYCVGPGSDEVRKQYQQNPKTDYHKLVQKLVHETAGVWIPRNADEAAASDGKFGTLTIKEINFGLVYGMGESKLGRMAGIDEKTQREVFAAYHSASPFVKATMKATQEECQRLGYTTTIDMRRSRFDEWEPVAWSKDGRAAPLAYQDALKRYGASIQRAHTHKAINRRLQGSAAAQLKRGMLECYRSGVYGVIGVPRLTVHDELDFSVIDNSPRVTEAHAEMRRTMETCIPLRVPVLFETARGPNWGACKD